MADLNRRQFLIAAATTAAVISLPVLQSDAQDEPTTKPSAKAIKVGTLKSFDKDGINASWSNKKKGGFFVIRQDSKLYACSSACTHRGVMVNVKGDELVCPAHGSHFSVQGTVTAGPARASLPRYAISVDADGNVMVDKSKQFSEAQWTDSDSFVAIPAA